MTNVHRDLTFQSWVFLIGGEPNNCSALVSLECMTHTIINFKCKRNVLFKQSLISNMCVRRAHDYFHSKAKKLKKLKKKGHGQKETRSN